MKRNMLAAAIFMLVGIYTWNNYSIATVCTVAAAVFVYCVLCCVNGRKSAAFLSIFALFLGFFIIHASNYILMEKANAFLGDTVKISGKVCGVYEKTYGQAFEVNHQYTDEKGKNKSIKVLAYSSDAYQKIKYGDIISFSANLKIPDTGGGFGDYNERMNERARGVLLETKGKIKNMTVYENKIDMKNIFDLSHVICEKIKARIEKFYRDDVAGILQGIIVGNKEKLPEDIKDSFRISGLSHILVVSGLHVNIILTILMFVLSMLGIGKSRPAIIIYILFIWLFTFITGMGLSAVRAATVVTIMFAGKIFKRDADSLNSLGAAVCIMLLVNPSVYFSIGLRLSVASVGAILIFSEDIRKSIKRLPAIICDTASVTAAAQIGTVPIIGQSFGSMGRFGFLANMLVCPVMAPLMALALLSLVLGDVPVIGAGIIWIVEKIVMGIIVLTKAVAAIPLSQMEFGKFFGVNAFIYLLFAAACKLFLTKKKQECKTVMLAALTLCCFLGIYTAFFDGVYITFLSTGNSDCTIIKNGECTIMIDGAGDGDYSVSESVIIPYMRREGIKAIDAAFVTHYHQDHAKGIVEMIEKGRIKRVVIPVGIYKSDFEIANAAEKAGIPLHYIGNSDKIKFGDMEIEAYNSFDGFEENNGMVYFVSYGEGRACIAGDVHKEGERILIQSGISLKSNILKVPHHGSDTSGSEEFLKKVSPEYAVILRGDDDYPTKEGENLYKNLGISLYSTYDCGSIKMKLSKSGSTQIYFGRNNLYELRNIKKTG